MSKLVVLLIVSIATGLTVLIVCMLTGGSKDTKKTIAKYNKLISFLEEADDAYITANETRDVMFFHKYTTERVCRWLIEIFETEQPRLFGTKNYRERKWSVIADTENMVHVRKDIVFKNIHLKKGLVLAVGDDMREYWKVAKESNSYRISDISIE